jgi:hypothetical protein
MRKQARRWAVRNIQWLGGAGLVLGSVMLLLAVVRPPAELPLPAAAVALAVPAALRTPLPEPAVQAAEPGPERAIAKGRTRARATVRGDERKNERRIDPSVRALFEGRSAGGKRRHRR